MVAFALAILAISACDSGDGSSSDSTRSTASPDTTTTTSTATPTSTTTTTVLPTSTTQPEESHPFDWRLLEVAEFESREKGGGFGSILTTPAGTWLVGGSINDAEGVPRPVVWISEDTFEWEMRELPDPGSGAWVFTGAWSGDVGLMTGNRAAPEREAGVALWLLDATGEAELVQSDVFPADLTILEASAQPPFGFVIVGRSNDELVLFRSPNGRDWTSDTSTPELLAGLNDPRLVTLAFGDLGLLAVILDERGQKDIGVLLLDRGNGFEEVARLEDSADVDLYGAVVTGAQFQVYGAVRNGPSYESYIWASGDGIEWEGFSPSVSIADTHTSYNTYGSGFMNAVRSTDGLVGVVFDAASYLFVGSEQGTDWSEIPIEGDVLDTDVPHPEEMAAAGGIVLAASTDTAGPVLYRIAEGRATQIVDDVLPAPEELLTATDSIVAGDRVMVTTSRVKLDRDLAATPERSSQVVAVGLDGEVEASDPVEDLYMSGVTVTEDGGIVVSGYERFITRFLRDGTVDPKAWWGESLSDLSEVGTGSPPEETTKRIMAVAAIDTGVVGFGSYFPESGISAPIFWYSEDGTGWVQIDAPEDRSTLNLTAIDLCGLPGGGAMAIGEFQTDSGAVPGVWVTSDGHSWSLTSSDPSAFGSDEQVSFESCVGGDEKTLILGSSGSPLTATAWETTDGTTFTPLDLPELGEASEWLTAALGPDGSLYMLGSRRVGSIFENELVVVSPDGTADVHSLWVEPLLGPIGSVSFDGLHVIDSDLVLVGSAAGNIQVWTAPIP